MFVSFNLIFRFLEVKFFYEVFRRVRPGNPLMALYGKQKQLKRVGIYEEFCRKSNAVLFATDIAARGLGTVYIIVSLNSFNHSFSPFFSSLLRVFSSALSLLLRNRQLALFFRLHCSFADAALA